MVRKHPTVSSRTRPHGGLFCKLADLHAHIAPSIPPSVYWHIAQSEGYKLVIRDYHEFVDFLVLSPEKKMTLKEYLDKVYHRVPSRAGVRGCGARGAGPRQPFLRVHCA